MHDRLPVYNLGM